MSEFSSAFSDVIRVPGVCKGSGVPDGRRVSSTWNSIRLHETMLLLYWSLQYFLRHHLISNCHYCVCLPHSVISQDSMSSVCEFFSEKMRKTKRNYTIFIISDKVCVDEWNTSKGGQTLHMCYIVWWWIISSEYDYFPFCKNLDYFPFICLMKLRVCIYRSAKYPWITSLYVYVECS